MLTTREFQITYKILSAQAGIRIKDLAEGFRVSPRAIQYDLENVKDFLKKQGVEFCSSSGKGIWAECTETQREAALAELSRLQGGNVFLTQEIRIQRILLQLIFFDGYITAGGLAEKLNVSRGTILNDMDQTHILLQDSGLLFSRKVSQGYRLEGREIALRTLAEKLLQDSMSVYDIYQIISKLKSGAVGGAFEQLLPEQALHDYRIIEDTMIPAFQEHATGLQDENAVAILLRTLISVSRVRMDYFVGDYPMPATGETHPLYPYWERVCQSIGLPVSKDEFDYVLGRYYAKNLPVDIAALSADLVASVSRMEDFPYGDDNTLYPRLLSHLRHHFSNDKANAARNPFHDLILENHSTLYKSILAVCKQHVDKAYLFSNDAMISYVALHFLTSQRNLGVGRKMRVVFVCATGRGAARIIARMLEAGAQRIEIVQHCSLAEVDEVVKHTKPDFIVSVFPIEADVPVVVVEPLPTKANIEAIRRLVEERTEPNELLYHNRLIDYHMDDDKQEEIAQEVVLAGLRIYAKLCEEPRCKVKPEMQFAFLAHVMLLAGRYVFDKQFTGSPNAPTDLERLIQGRLEEVGVYLNPDEIKALTYYFDSGPPITRQPQKT